MVNVGKYTGHGSYGMCVSSDLVGFHVVFVEDRRSAPPCASPPVLHVPG